MKTKDNQNNKKEKLKTKVLKISKNNTKLHN
jgi:hypothetical protein